MLKSSNSLANRQKKDTLKRKYFLQYTVLFALMALIVNFVFIREGATYVRSVDGYVQHIVALEYYGQWLRDFFVTLFTEHRFEFKSFDFSIGMGSDVVTTLNYYAIGDPLNLLSVLVPREYTAYLYTFLTVLRNYLAGAAFSLYCFERKHKNTFGILAGALLYAFSVFAVVAGPMHPFFVNPMIYMPLLFIAVEKILKGKNPVYLALIVCLAEISNFYFFYMLVFATVFYVFVRLFTIYRVKIKTMVAPLFKIALSAFSGVLMGAVIFYPVVIAVLSDGRASVEHSYPLLYDAQYYLTLLSSMVYYNGFEPWTLVGSGVLCLYAVAALFLTKKKNTGMKLAFIVCLVGLCLPAFGGFSNGFSYASNRWCFIFTFLLAFLCSHLWQEMFFTKNKIKGLLIAFLPALYAGCCVFMPYAIRDRLKYALVFFALSSVIFVFVTLLPKKQRLSRLLQTAVIVVNLVFIGVNALVVTEADIEYFYSQNEVSTTVSKEFSAVKSQTELTGESDFFRYTSNKMDYNGAVRSGGYGTQYYWSLSDGYISDFQDSVYLNEGFYQHYNGFDDIAVFSTLSSVKYYFDKTNQPGTVPFGFEKTETEKLYENKYALPLVYAYDSFVTRNELDSLTSSPQKQQVLLKNAVLDEETEFVKKGDSSFSLDRAQLEITPGSEFVTISSNSFTVTKKNSTVTLTLKSKLPGEAYLSLRNMSYRATSPVELFSDNTEADPLGLFGESNLQQYGYSSMKDLKQRTWQEPELCDIIIKSSDGSGLTETKKLRYYTPYYRFYAGKKDFDICLGYSEDGFTRVTVTFPRTGIYTFDSISVDVQQMDFYTEGVKKLTEGIESDTAITTDKITSTVKTESDSLLCFSVPYSKGWKAFVDGKEVPVLRANIMHMALEVTAGEHEIVLEYSSPYMKTGAIISFFGCLLLFSSVMWYHFMRKKKTIDFVEVD